ncbi:MAG: hypothetical protein KA059_05785 [Elusimicrobiales bacterium]|nr:hypothetical protein [Elusimicrobiales bacterium]
MKIKKRKGTLAAILVLIIMIITISTYVMKWAFDRHTTATRLYKSSITKVQGEGVMYNRVACCRYGVGCQSSVNGKTTSISVNCSASNATTFTVDITED